MVDSHWVKPGQRQNQGPGTEKWGIIILRPCFGSGVIWIAVSPQFHTTHLFLSLFRPVWIRHKYICPHKPRFVLVSVEARKVALQRMLEVRRSMTSHRRMTLPSSYNKPGVTSRWIIDENKFTEFSSIIQFYFSFQQFLLKLTHWIWPSTGRPWSDLPQGEDPSVQRTPVLVWGTNGAGRWWDGGAICLRRQSGHSAARTGASTCLCIHLSVCLFTCLSCAFQSCTKKTEFISLSKVQKVCQELSGENTGSVWNSVVENRSGSSSMFTCMLY